MSVFLAILLGWLPAVAQADLFSRASDEFMAYCSFGPKVQVVSSMAASGGGSGCGGGAKVQAVLWECSASSGVTARVDGFRKRLIELAEQECDRFCSSKGKGCTGKL